MAQPLMCPGGFVVPEKKGKIVVESIELTVPTDTTASEAVFWDVWDEHYTKDGQKLTYPELITKLGTTYHKHFGKVEVQRAAAHASTRNSERNIRISFGNLGLTFINGIRARLLTNFRARIYVR